MAKRVGKLPRASRSKPHRAWTAAVVLLVAGGIAGAALAASSVAGSDAGRSRQRFEGSSAEIASTLQLAIHDQESLAVNASAFVLENPHASNAQFARWLTFAQAFERYPQLIGLGEVVVVPAAQEPAFAAQAAPDPSGPLGPDGAFQLIPPGARPFYCLAALGHGRSAATALPAGFDVCADPTLREQDLTARDSGQSSYAPVKIEGVARLGVQVPIYGGGVVPATVEARRSDFVGWLGMFVDVRQVLDRSLQSHAGMSVSMRYHANSSDVGFTSGQASSGQKSVSIDLHNGWIVDARGFVASGSIFGDSSARALLVTGVLLSLLLGALVLVLVTGRARAFRLVEQRTGQLRHQAMHDALTGLPNRALILDRIEQMLARNRREGTQGAVLFIDVDEFKNVNDTLGHGAGDRLLVAVAARLTTTLRDADTFGRMGGDEFVVLVDGGQLAVGPELVATRLLDVMRQPFELDGPTPLCVNVSVGIAVGPRSSAGELLRDADVALYRAKAEGKNRYVIFDPEMQSEISRRVGLEFDLRSALAQEQFRLVYQPIYDLDDRHLAGVEALLRWQHPSLGLLSPDEFIPILEQTGQIREVGAWVLRTACDQMAAWHARGDTLDVSVNVSGRQLDDDAIVEHIRQALDDSGLDAGSLIVEVTETALMQHVDATARRLRAIAALGVRIAVDDFGTGYSSLAHLQQFPVDCLKIDRSFITAISASPESKALITTLVQLGRDLGLTTLAEGVETSSQMDHLRGQHVDQVQGFLLARPLEASVLEDQLLAPARLAALTDHRP